MCVRECAREKKKEKGGGTFENLDRKAGHMGRIFLKNPNGSNCCASGREQFHTIGVHIVMEGS